MRSDQAPDFEGLLEEPSFQDIRVVVMEEAVHGGKLSVGGKRTRSSTASPSQTSITLGANSAVLWSFSPCFKAKLQRWTDTDVNNNSKQYQHQLQLLVPPEQLELGRRLITSMYASAPDLSDLDPQQLLQLAALAECYQVGKVLAAAGKALGRLPQEQLTEQVVAALYELPASCLELEAFKAVMSRVGEYLQQQFGDLEVVWADSQKQRALLQLPFTAFKQLLEDPATAVASEDTVVYTIGRWLEEHRDTGGEQLEQLAGLVRLLHCTQTFMLSAAAADDSWVLKAGYTAADFAAACCLMGKSTEQRIAWVDKFYSQHPAWEQSARPASSKSGSCSFSWELPLQQLQEALSASDGRAEQPTVAHAAGVWCGHRWTLAVFLPSADEGLGLYVGAGANCCFSADFEADTRKGPRRQFSIHSRLVAEDEQTGLDILESAQGLTSWAELEAVLRQQHLVHPDGCLHLRVTVSDLS